MARHADNVTALLYRRRQRADSAPADPAGGIASPGPRRMAFDPFLVFTAVLVAGAAVVQVLLIVSLEF